MSEQLTHIADDGSARMVDVGAKPESERLAVADGWVVMQSQTLQLIREGNIKKGDVLTIARIAGIMGAKHTSDLIPLCHPIALSHIDVTLSLDEARSAVHIKASTRTIGKTGVEMEALTAVTIAALTIYDMAKAVDRSMRIEGIRLLEKRGGIHGDYVLEE
jgi:cyclic pyranopterin monophosphate synthase